MVGASSYVILDVAHYCCRSVLFRNNSYIMKHKPIPTLHMVLVSDDGSP
jgi:hypothetical protein